MPVFPTADPTFRACGAGWDGVVALVVQAVPRAGAANDHFVRLVNHQGRWSDGGAGADEAVIRDAVFVLRGEYTVWVDLIQSDLPPVKAIAQGALTYCGHVPVALSPVVWVMEFVELAAHIDTQVLDDAPPPRPPTGFATAPETRYAVSGSLRIAYSVFGEGPVDLVMVPGLISHVDYAWAEPSLARFLRRLSAFTRTIAYDKRGMGLSDRDPQGDSTMADRMDDLNAVMQAAGSLRAVLFAWSEGDRWPCSSPRHSPNELRP